MQDLREAIDRPAIREMAPKAGVAAAVVLVAVIAGVGFLIYKQRRRQTLMQRVQDALPEMDDLRATLKRPLRRAVKIL
jgi:negative regulator of sigma E activity